MDYANLKVENAEELNAILNGILPTLATKAVLDGMVSASELVNAAAYRALMASRKDSTSGYYYQSSFKYEKVKNKTPDKLGIRTGVWNRQNGYKLRWLEWGTDERKTFKRVNRMTNTVTQKMSRGKITGSNYFFNAVKDNQERMFEVMSKAIVKSLEKLTADNA